MQKGIKKRGGGAGCNHHNYALFDLLTIFAMNAAILQYAVNYFSNEVLFTCCENEQ